MIEKGDPENMAQSSGEIKIKEEYDSKKMAGRIEQLIGVRREEFYGAIREYEKEVESYDEAKIKERIKEIETNIPEWRREKFKRQKKELEYNLTKKGLNTTREAFKIILFNFVIEQIINDLNAERIIKIIDELKIARIMDVEDNAEDNRKNAINSLMEGRLTYICPFAGMGSRMLNALKKIHGKVSYNQKKNYKIANINPWHLAKEVGEKIFERIKLAEDPSEHLGKLIRDLEAIDENGKPFKKCAPLLVEAIMKSMGFIIPKGEDKKEIHLYDKASEQVELPVYANDKIGIAERQMRALRQGIENLDISREEKKQVLANMKLIIPISNDIEENVKEIFRNNKFFELTPENVVFVKSGYGLPFVFDKDKNIVSAKNEKTMTWNHGVAFIELLWTQNAYTLDAAGETEKPLDAPVFKYIKDKGACDVCVRRINDLNVLIPELAVDTLMYEKYLETECDGLFEMNKNTTSQKGGLALAKGKKLFLLEELAGKDAKGIIQRNLNELDENIPYNRLYGYLSLAALYRELSKTDLPLSIRARDIKEGKIVITPEIPIGDLTTLPGLDIKAVMRKDDYGIDHGLFPDREKETGEEHYVPGKGSLNHDLKSLIPQQLLDAFLLLSKLDDPKAGIINPDLFP